MNFILVFFIILILLAGTSSSIEYLIVLQKPFFLLGSLGLIFVCILLKKKIKFNKTNFLIFNTFIFLCYVAALYHSDFELLKNALSMHSSYLVLVVIMPSINNGNNIIKNAVYILSFVIILLSIVINNPFSVPYYGLFLNANSFAILLATLFAILIGDFTEKVINNNLKFKSMFPWLLVIMIVFFLIVMTSSRTGFFSAFTLILVSLLSIYVGKKSIIWNFTIKNIFKFSMILLFITYLTFEFQLINVFNETIVAKKENRIGLSGREVIWEKTFNEVTLLGHGDRYFSENFGLGAHNVFIWVLGSSGVLSLFMIIFFYFNSMFIIYSDLKKSMKENNIKLIPSFVMVSFFLLSLTEGILLTTLTFVMFLLLGNASKQKMLKYNI